VGLRPLMNFCGALFDVHPRYQHFKSLMMDFFRGQMVESMEVDGLQHVVCCSVGEQQPQSYDSTKEDLPPIKFRVYLIQSKKVAGSKVPRIELEEMGPLKIGSQVGTISRSEPRDNEYGVEETQGDCGIYIYDACVSDFLGQDEEDCGD
jgi:ribosome production factor 2